MTEQEKKPKIDAIYPLSIIQQGLLFHHLSNGKDQGLLHVHTVLEGDLNISALKKAWNTVIERHEVLRTTVHWKNIEKPLLVVRPSKEIEWATHDFSEIKIEDLNSEIEKFKEADKEAGINLEKNPSLIINLIKINNNEHILLWKCHHLLLDGWSAGIILRDVFKSYDAICQSKEAVFENAPPSYKNYLSWQKSRNKKEAEHFWKHTFKDFSKPTLFNKDNRDSGNFTTKSFRLDQTYNEALRNTAKKYRITLNTLCQGIWSLLLSQYFNTTEITFGNTVSGRSGDFTDIEIMAGMFINMLPVRINTDADISFEDWLKDIQSHQQKTRNYEDTTNQEINEWVNNSSKPLFDNLFVFENFPWKDIKSGDILVKQFKSGITSNYPLTFIARVEDHLKFDIMSDTNIINKDIPSWFLDNLKLIIDYITTPIEITLNGILEQLKEVPNTEITTSVLSENKTTEVIYAAPSNTVELELVKIWESMFNKSPIGIHDNYFTLGGKSLMAVKLFSKIEKTLGVSLPPVILLENPTIYQISNIIKEDKPIKSWNNLVPLRSTGNKEPIFCLHAGGGHVFFYNPLAKYLDKDRPVYAIKPSGLYGKLPMHETIEAMAIDYVNEILMAYPKGPYNLLVYCHSTAVGFEMSNLLKSKGHKARLIVMDTMAEQEYVTKSRLKMRILGFLKRLTKNPIDVIGTMIAYRFKKYIKPWFINMFGKEEAKHTSNTMVHLIDIYNQYRWKNYKLPVTLVLTNKVNKLFNQEILSSWHKIANNVTTINIKGDHRTLFDEPDVKFVAKALDDYLE
ncbi:condensation domain-containing protein [Winogradskyella sp. R77965]|uniref:condensation domain-containing protein n=1 Tax=Winogradskyella sp. R77965 TaxID=3093872 RepID=UPI0037DD3223